MQARGGAIGPFVWYVERRFGGEPFVVDAGTGAVIRPFAGITLSRRIPFNRAEQIVAGRRSLAMLCSSPEGDAVELYGIFPGGEILPLAQDNPLFEAPFGVMTNPLFSDDDRPDARGIEPQGDTIIVALSNGGRPESTPGVIVRLNTANVGEPEVVAEGGEVFTDPLAITSVGVSIEIEGGPCNAADSAEPFGTLDIGDVVEFLQRFGAGDSDADLAAPFGTFDIADVVAFLQVFGAGCP